MQLQNILSKYLWLNCNDKRINTNNKSDIFIKSLQDTICILKKELINKENAIKNLYIILKNIRSNTYIVSPLNKESVNELILEDNTDRIDSENLCYQHLINHPINQSRPLAMTNAAMRLILPNSIKLLNLMLKSI